MIIIRGWCNIFSIYRYVKKKCKYSNQSLSCCNYWTWWADMQPLFPMTGSLSLSLSLSLLFLSLSFFIFLRILKCLWGLVHECQHWFECLQGENLPYKHGVFTEYRWCSHIAESCCRLSATCTEQSSREIKSGGTGERPETATGIAERKAL